MNWKWYLPILFLTLAFIGVSLEQSGVPNQEIVVQFDANAISSDEIQCAVSGITNQLESIGIYEFQVSEIYQGKLKVTYFSTVDVAIIKALFYERHSLKLAGLGLVPAGDSGNIPFGKDSKNYKLDVIQIQEYQYSNIGLQGLPVLVQSTKDHYLKPFVSLGGVETEINLKRFLDCISFGNYCNTSLSTANSSHKIPESRAGPLT